MRRKLTPDMPFGCKRPLASNVYYPTFNLPHVELVTEPITEITDDAVVTADGRAATGRHHHPRHRVRDHEVPRCARRGRPRRCAHRRRVGRRRPGLSRDHHQRLPEPVHALRPEHQQRLDHLHDRVPGRLRDAGAPTHGRRGHRRARRQARRDGRVQRRVAGHPGRRRGLAGGVPRLLPRAVRPHRDAVAGFDVGVPRPHPATRDPDDRSRSSRATRQRP